MATQVEICNYALGLIGAEPITAISENTREAKSCSNFYSLVMMNLLRSHNWNFAVKRATLTGTTNSTFEFKYKIQKPTDYVRIVSFYDYTGEFKEEGDYILLNQQTVKLKYVHDDIDEGDFDASFSVCLASKLADAICYQITQSATLLQMVKQTHKEDLAQARRNNAISNSADSFQEPTWITTRL